MARNIEIYSKFRIGDVVKAITKVVTISKWYGNDSTIRDAKIKADHPQTDYFVSKGAIGTIKDCYISHKQLVIEIVWRDERLRFGSTLYSLPAAECLFKRIAQ